VDGGRRTLGRRQVGAGDVPQRVAGLDRVVADLGAVPRCWRGRPTPQPGRQ
jgi:hypothetical protein